MGSVAVGGSRKPLVATDHLCAFGRFGDVAVRIHGLRIVGIDDGLLIRFLLCRPEHQHPADARGLYSLVESRCDRGAMLRRLNSNGVRCR